jgi:hypothetical protein
MIGKDLCPRGLSIATLLVPPSESCANLVIVAHGRILTNSLSEKICEELDINELSEISTTIFCAFRYPKGTSI